MEKMSKNKSVFFVFILMAILVIIGVIFLSRGREGPFPADTPQTVETGPTPGIPVEKETSVPRIPAPASEGPSPTGIQVGASGEPWNAIATS